MVGRIRAGGIWEGGGGNCLKYLKRDGTEKRGGDTKIFEDGGQVGSRGGCLKKMGAGTLLTNYGLQMSYFLELCGAVSIQVTCTPIFMVCYDMRCL